MNQMEVQELPEDPLLPGLAAGLALPEVLMHTEIQEGRSARPMDERMYEYNHGFHQVYKLPVMSLLCWFGPGRPGISDAIYERAALGQWTVRFRYRQVGIRNSAMRRYGTGPNIKRSRRWNSPGTRRCGPLPRSAGKKRC
jgi:hypothetical protein